MIDQIFPVQKQIPLERLYLAQQLMDIAAETGRRIVLTDFLTDKHGVVAQATQDDRFEIPGQLKNASDWSRYQELLAQSEVMISSGSYFKRLASGDAQNILYQFELGQKFEHLGQWRLETGFKKRSPDVAIVTRHLDFELPRELQNHERRVIIFTTNSIANSDQAKSLSHTGIDIIGRGETGVDGHHMISTLANAMGYRVIMMVSGPPVFELLLAAQCIDLIYVTEAQLEIPFDDPKTVQRILPNGKKVNDLRDFHLTHQFIQQHVIPENGSSFTQSFLRYDSNDLWR